MPRYFFNTRIGDETIRDEEGEELRDPDQAWEVAKGMIVELLRDEGDEPRDRPPPEPARVPSVDQHLAVVLSQACERAERRRLPRTVRADQRVPLPHFQLERYIVVGREGAPGFREADGAQGDAHDAAPRKRTRASSASHRPITPPRAKRTISTRSNPIQNCQ